MAFSDFNQALKEQVIPLSMKLFQKTGKEEKLSIPKSDSTRGENHNLCY